MERSHFSFSFLVFYRSVGRFLANKSRREKHRKGDIDILARDFVRRSLRFPLAEWGKWDDHMNAHLSIWAICGRETLENGRTAVGPMFG